MDDARPRAGKWFPFLVKLLLSLIVVVFLAALLFPVSAGDNRSSKRTMQLSHIKQIGLGLEMYANDYDDRLPPAMSSSAELRTYGMPYVKPATVFDSMNLAGGEILGNGLLAGKKTSDIAHPAATVMVYDSRPWADRAAYCDANGGAHWNVTFETMLQQLTVDPFADKRTSHD